MNDLNKYKLKIIIKTYLHLHPHKKFTSGDLADFINNYFNMKEGVTNAEIAGLLVKRRHGQNILKEIKDEEVRGVKQYYY